MQGAEESAPPRETFFLHGFNEKLERGAGIDAGVLETLHERWLLREDPDGVLHEECGSLNRMHLLGILLCRAYYREHGESLPGKDWNIVDFFPTVEQVHIYDKPIVELSLREFEDVVLAIQLHFSEILEQEETSDVKDALRALFTRAGFFATFAMSDDVMDNKSSVTFIPSHRSSDVYMILTCKTLRTLVNVFLVLQRAVHVRENSIELEITDDAEASDKPCAVPHRHVSKVASMIHPYHIEASHDNFNVLQQLFFLKPAQRLVYKHNFWGMYNDVSQIVYFHYPDYVRSPQVKADEMPLHAMHSVAPLQAIFPELKTVFDDEHDFPSADPEWKLMISASRVFLWNPEIRKFMRSQTTGPGPDPLQRRSHNPCFPDAADAGIMDLVAFYLLAKHGVDFFEHLTKKEAEDEKKNLGNSGRVRFSDHGHARLL